MTVYFEHGRMTLHHGDCREVLPSLPDNSVDAVVTDPPYELAFMGRTWDATGVAFCAETWRAVLRVLKPGGHLLACGGTRTFHRLTCAIEDAGFEVRDCLLWLTGQGFPKSLDVGKALDKMAGAERAAVGVTAHPDGRPRNLVPRASGVHGGGQRQNGVGLPITAPATDLARQWDGWGTALKPGWESIILAQKPLTLSGEQGIIVANLSRLEAQLWSLLPASTAGASFGLSPHEHDAVCASAQWSAGEQASTRAALSDLTATSQFVSVLSTCLSTVRSWSDCLADLCAQTSTSTTATGSSLTIDLRTLRSCLSDLTPLTIIRAATTPDGCGLRALSAARCLSAVVAKWTAIRALSALGSATAEGRISRLGEDGTLSPAWEPVLLCRKPLRGTVAANVARYGVGGINVDGCRIETDWSTDPTRRGWQGGNSKTVGVTGNFGCVGDRVSQPNSAGRWPANVCLDEEAAALLDAQSGESLSSGGSASLGAFRGGRVYGDGRDERWKADPGYGDSGGASRYFYVAKASKRDRGEGNTHPTVKPRALMAWLCRLVTPPGGVILDPFAGSGSTGVAALAGGYGFIGIELVAEYIAIARRRLEQLALPVEAVA